MSDLGYARYGAHGGDWGVLVTGLLGWKYPRRLAGIHRLIGGIPRVEPQAGESVDRRRRASTTSAAAADGIGDYNPLWRDEEYAAKNRFGQITAMPSFVYSASLGVGAAINGAITPSRVEGFAMNYAGGELGGSSGSAGWCRWLRTGWATMARSRRS